MPTLNVTLPKPHAGQKAVLRSKSRFRLVIAGRRWRKTSLAMMACVEYALSHPNKRVLWASPVYSQAEIGMREALKAVAGAAAPNLSKMSLTFPTGSQIIFRSTEREDSIRGETVDFAVLDEVADIPEGAWTEVIRPMLMDTRGRALFIGTPKGRNWIWKLANKSIGGAEDWQFFQAPSLGCEIVDGALVRVPHPLENPNIRWDELLALWDDMGERVFRQEILAEFLDSERGVFRNVPQIANLAPRTPYQGRFSCGVDLAQQTDYTVLSVIDADSRSQVDVDRFNRVDWELAKVRIKGVLDSWKPRSVVVERNSIGGPIIDSLKRDGVRITDEFVTTAQSKAQIIESLALAIEKQEIKLLDNAVQTAELEAYERILSDHTGRARYSAPQGLHDDTVMALALAWHGVASRPKSLWATPTARAMWES